MRGKFRPGVLWACVFLRHEQVLPATEALLELSAAENQWISTGTLSARESVETHTGLLHGTSLDTFDGRVEHQSPVDSRPCENSPITDKPELGALRKSALTKGFGAILALVLCALFLSAERKTRILSTPESSSKEEPSYPSRKAAGEDASTQENGTASKRPVGDKSEALRRLQRVRVLLPAASRLAAAVGTTEAQKLLGSVQKAFSEARSAAESDEKRLESSLNDGMQALRSLHQAALQQAKVLAQDGAQVPVFSLLESEEVEGSMENELEHVIEGDTVLPFMVYLRSLQESVIGLSRRFEDAHERLLAETHFADERDEYMLVSAVAELEWLLSLGERKRQVIQRATTLKGCAICGIRIHLRCHVEEWMRTLQGSMELLQAYVGLVSNAIQSSFENPNPLELAEEDSSSVHNLRRKLTEVKELLSELRKAKQDVHASTSVGSAAAAFKKAEQIKGEAQTLLDDCWDTTKVLPSPNHELTTSDTALLARSATKALVIADEENAAIGASLSTVYSRCSDALQKSDTAMANAKHINPAVAEQLRAHAKETEDRVALHMKRIQHSATQLQSTEDLTDAIMLLEDLGEHIPVLVECNKRAVLLVLESYLHTLLEEDIQASVKAAAHAFSSKLTLTGPNKMLFEKLQRRFNKAKMAATKAANLTEAAQAAAKIRMHGEALSDFASDLRRGRVEPP
ncbi:hypothetical protein, conserved [Eimeria praecox]|uniref:Uncharacterized protein n=1 Tax=Eimeria praecox TaxID=51316 RepID=U6H1T5_9EIME|nr:hypothetical protein, conserved [Eimeria praecox]